MRVVPCSVFLASIVSLFACKSPSSFALKASDSQKDRYRSCIVATIMDSAEILPDENAVRAFASEMVSRLPNDDDRAMDAALHDYAGKLDCDPTQEAKAAGVTKMLVAAWSNSPYNARSAQGPLKTSVQ